MGYGVRSTILCGNITLKRKGMDYSTETFERIKFIDEKTKAPKWKDEE